MSSFIIQHHFDGGIVEKIFNCEIDNNIMSEADDGIFQAVFRLVEIRDNPMKLGFMSKHIKREIILNALCSSCGKQFLQSMINTQQAGEIYELNSWIKENFRDNFSVEQLAEHWNMSVSQLHQKFKDAVGMGPLQCQKRLRLTEARRLMLDENKNVTEAAFGVGYESVSQFTREYRKMFGQAPKADISELRTLLKK